MKPDFSANRFEIKYVMHASAATALHDNLKDILISDDNTSLVSNGYFNHSIYFDGLSLQRYLEKHEGHDRRIKLRLRSYRDHFDGVARAHFLESKHRRGGIVKKDRLKLSVEQADFFLQPKFQWPLGLDQKSSVAQAFLFHAKSTLLRPFVTVQYHREAYHTKIYPGVRITFDRRVCASKDFRLPGSGISVPEIPSLHPSFCVVELKYNHKAPKLLIERFRDHEVRQATFSKYATAMETVYDQHAAVHRARRYSF